MHGGKVPMFKMKAQRGTLWLAIFILVLGFGAFVNGHKDPGDIPAADRANIFLAVAIIVTGILLILSTGRMWFKHLWHDRYGRR